MRFDTTHEYFFTDPCINYCEDHDALMICSHGDSTDRVIIAGLEKGVMDNFRIRLNKESLEQTVQGTTDVVD